MLSPKMVSAMISMVQKPPKPTIDRQRIKSIISKKLQDQRIPNPQQLVQQLDSQIQCHIQRTQEQISRQMVRQQKIAKLEEESLKARNLLKSKIEQKIERSSNQKEKQEKEKVQKKLKQRKLKQQLFEARRSQIVDRDWRQRFQKFKQIKAGLNQNQQNDQPNHRLVNKMNRSQSMQSVFNEPINKKRQLEELQYFKKMELLEKRKIYDKPEKKVILPHSVDKTEWISKLNQQSENHFIQKLGRDLEKIQQARIKKEKSIKQMKEKMAKQSELEQEQRTYRVETLKQDMVSKIKQRKELLSKKNERSMRNKSTSRLLARNWSDKSGNSQRFLQSHSKMSKTLTNFKVSLSLDHAKANDYLERERQRKIRKQAKQIIEKVIKDEKIEVLIK